MNWLNTKYMTHAGILTMLLLSPSLLSAICKPDTIIGNHEPDSLKLVIKTDSIIASHEDNSAFTVVKANTAFPYIIEPVFRTGHDRRVHRFCKSWERIIPTHFKVQYTGNMGLLSFGTGQDYGKRSQWEIDLLLGFIPKYSSEKAEATMTLKQDYMPWSINLGKGFPTEPPSCGSYLNTVFGSQLWINEPERYPKGYYGFSSKVRIHILMGQRLIYGTDPNRQFLVKSVTFFYKISTCDPYLISGVTNNYLRPRDYPSSSFGLKFQWL